MSNKLLEEQVGQQLLAQGLTIACAESCTGGLLTSRLTDIAGSSAYVMGSVVSYTNRIKETLVGVQHETLLAHGAVSEETAREMAEGIRRAIETDIGVGITGIAGPGGGSEKKPVGQVVFARALRGQDPDDYFTQRIQFDSKDRAAIRHAATLFALDLFQPDKDSLRPSEDIELPAP